MAVVNSITTCLAIDPGETTGIARATIDGRRLVSIDSSQSRLSPVQLWCMLAAVSPLHLVAEQFDYRNDSRPGLVLYSRNLLGVCEVWTALHNCSFSQQSASQGFAFWSDAKLRKAGCYNVGKEHARDATRHLLTWLTFHRGSRLWTTTNLPFLPQFANVLGTRPERGADIAAQ